jgi:hypothetical protein
MKERVKVFTYVSGHGTTLIEPPLEDHINQWLPTVNGRITAITQSESGRASGGQHVTVCIWYVPEEPASASF